MWKRLYLSPPAASRSNVGVEIGPPNPLGLPKPASSVSTSSTFGAPSGAGIGAMEFQSGTEPSSVRFTTPWNGGRRIGRLVRSMPGRSRSSLLGQPHCGRRPRGCRPAVREPPGLIAEVRLEVGRRDLHPEGALAHLALAEVAQQRQQRPDLAACVRETGAVDVRAPLRGAELPDLLQVDAPIPPADGVGGEALPGQNLLEPRRTSGTSAAACSW